LRITPRDRISDRGHAHWRGAWISGPIRGGAAIKRLAMHGKSGTPTRETQARA